MNRINITIAFIIVSTLIPSSGFIHSALSEDNWYSQGLWAFKAGKDLVAARFMIKAVRKDKGCRAVFEDTSLQSLPSECPEKNSVALGDPAPMVLFQLGRLRWEEETMMLEAQGILRKNQHSRLLLEKLVQDYPSSSYSDDAALFILQDSLCYRDEGYPDCTIFEIRQYEKFLEKYPFSDKKPEVLCRLAEKYFYLAGLYAPEEDKQGRPGNEKPWESKSRAELFLGQSQKICTGLIDRYPSGSFAEKSRQLFGKINDSGLTPSFIRGIE
jgi:hypothetical protein